MRVIHSMLDLVSELKEKPRTGWVDHMILFPETVWQHCISMHAVSYELALKYLGRSKAVHCGTLGGIHDITEGIVTDITPNMNISIAQKKELENLAINHISTLSKGGKKIKDLWLNMMKEQQRLLVLSKKSINSIWYI